MENIFFTELLINENLQQYEEIFNKCPLAPIQTSINWSKIISHIPSHSTDIPFFLICKKRDNNDNYALVAGLVVYLFEGSCGKILTSIPQAGPLGGVIILENIPEIEKKKIYYVLMESALNLAKKYNCISLTIITNPFQKDDNLYLNNQKPDYILENFCQVIDLDHIYFDENNEIKVGLRKFNHDLKRNILKAKKLGTLTRWGDINDFESWYEIHKKRHRELGAPPLPEDLLKKLIINLKPEGKSGFIVAECEGKIVGGAIFVWNQNISDLFILSSDSDFFKTSINYVIMEFAIRYFKDKKIKFLNFQSCKRNSGVYEFKSKWKSSEYKYSFLTWTLPGIEKIFEKDIQQISKLYPWHYVLPFQALDQKNFQGYYIK